MTEQSERQQRETEQMEIVIEHTEMVGNRRECHGKAGERWRRSEKIRYMTLYSVAMCSHCDTDRRLRRDRTPFIDSCTGRLQQFFVDMKIEL